MKLKTFLDFKVNNPKADFWIIRRGNSETVGTTTREFSPDHIGVTITRPDLVLPDFMFYYMDYLAKVGALTSVSSGSGTLRQINIKDLGEFELMTA